MRNFLSNRNQVNNDISLQMGSNSKPTTLKTKGSLM